MILSAHGSRLDGYDCCVVGAGPVGLAFAMESARAGRTVLLIEAGDRRSSKRAVAALADRPVEVVDPARHAPIDLTVRRGIGGTSRLWGGRCVPFEPIDFEPRDYVPDSEWPISYDDVVRWHERTAEYLDCGTAVFRSPRPDWDGLGDFQMSNLERWARQPRLGPRLGADVVDHPRIHVLLDSLVADIDFSEDGSVRGLAVQRHGERIDVHAESYVLAMGGLEVTSLLLAQQRRRPDAFGGVGGPLGRYYMGHATGSIADIVLTDPERVGEMDFELDDCHTYIRRRFTLSEAAQRRHRVLNTAFYLDNPPFYEYDHLNPTLSLVFMALAIRPIGRRIIAEGIRLRHIGPPPYRYGPHVRNVLSRPGRAAGDMAEILSARYLSRVRKPGFILRNAGGRYALHYHAEQLPNPDSRLSIDAENNASDAPLRIDYRYLEQDIDSLLKSHHLLDEQLQASGIGRLDYLAPDDASIRALAWEQSTDGFHSIGTTRMSRNPGDGVVDADCRVHGSSNLYIASSSVFRTAGEANPTFLAACLAVRLANHLASAPAGPRRLAVTPMHGSEQR